MRNYNHAAAVLLLLVASRAGRVDAQAVNYRPPQTLVAEISRGVIPKDMLQLLTQTSTARYSAVELGTVAKAYAEFALNSGRADRRNEVDGVINTLVKAGLGSEGGTPFDGAAAALLLIAESEIPG